MADVNPKPILCVDFGPIGDTLIMLALFEDILRLEPRSRFTVISSSNIQVIRDLASAYTCVEVLAIPSKPLAMFGFLRRIISHSWIVLVPGSAKGYSLQIKAFFMALRAFPGNITIGFGDIRTQSGWLPFDKGLFVNTKISILNNYRRMIPEFMTGIDTEALYRQPIHALVQPVRPASFPFKPKSYIVIHMFGTRARLSFPPKRWTTILSELSRRYPACGLVLTGGTKDQALIEQVSAGIPRTYVCIGRPILEVAGIISDSALYIGVDTGVTHLAAVLHHPSVVVGNNSNPLWLPTYNPEGVILMNLARCTCSGDKSINCRVDEDGAGYHCCTYDITPDDFYRSVERKLRR